MKKILLHIVLVLLVFANNAQAQSWNLAETTVKFSIKNAGITVNGTIGGFNGQIVFDENQPEHASFSGTVQVATLKTGIDARDEHLMNENYFNEAKFKTISIKSVSVSKVANGFSGQFMLTIKGKTLPVNIPFSFTRNGNTAAFEGTFTINRLDFGIGNKSWILSDEVKLSISIHAKQ